jgi:TATA-box binding protein (TBP) (component of TFIID and TFIIIB)
MEDLNLPWLDACSEIVDAQQRLVPWMKTHQPPGVTMMTVCVHFVKTIDTRALEAHVHSDDESPFAPVAENFAGAAFAYSNTNMHVKVFASGNVHVAGARSSVEVVRMLHDLKYAILVSSGDIDERYVSDGLECVSKASYPLLNVLMSTTTKIALGKLHDELISRGWPSLYATSAGKKSPGLRIRLPSCSVLFYASGKINISASSGPGGNGASACAAVARGFGAAFEALAFAEKAGGVVGDANAAPTRTASARPVSYVDGYVTDVFRLCS